MSRSLRQLRVTIRVHNELRGVTIMRTPGALLATALASAFLGGAAFAQTAPASTQVTPKVTATTVSAPVAQGSGSLVTVSTATVSGSNAYNAFSTFNVASPDTVDLLLPSGTTNLINLVDNQALIWGKVNALLGGQIGGNVYFADPQGLIVGSTGAINVGSLTVVTPSLDFMNGFFDGSGNPTGESATLTGNPASIALNGSGLISIAGAVKAAGPVNLIAPTVNVAGNVTTGGIAATPDGDPNFDPLLGGIVNTTGLNVGQAITIDGNTITIDGGTAQAKLFAGSSGDIDLNANEVVDLQWIPGLTFFQAPSASASITIGNAELVGNNINLNAVASTTKLANPPAGSINTASDGGDFLQNVGYSSTPGDTSLTPLFDNPAFNGLTELAGVAISKANADISIGQNGSSELYASGGISINSSATSNVEVQTIGLYTGVTYGESDADAVAAIGGNAFLNANGAVSMEAEINNSLLLSTSTASGVQGTATSTPEPAVALAYGVANSNSSATVAPGATIFGNLVSVEADNANSFESEASGSEYQAATNSSGAGIGIALGFYTSNANASLGGDIVTRGFGSTPPLTTVGGATVNMGDVNVAANSINSTNSTESSSSVSDEMNNAGIFSQVPFTANIAQFASSENPNAEANANALNLSGAVSYADTTNNANATIPGGGDVNAGWEYGQPGNIMVNALAQDAPDIAAAGSAGGGAASIGGSVAISSFGNFANASISGQADAASAVSVLANASLPNRLNAGPFEALPGQFDNLSFTAPTSASGFEDDWNAVGTLVGDLETALNPNGSDLGEFLNDNGGLNNLLTSFVNTGASANGGSNSDGYGVAGSLNFLNINNAANATISGTVNAPSGLTLEADAEANLINWAGTGAAIGPLKEHNIGVKGDGTLGGAYDGVDLTNSATAAVKDSAVIQAGSVTVNSNTDEFLVNIAQAGADAEKFGITGAFDWVTANDTSLAYIQSDARVNASGGNVDLNANNNLNDFSIGGALGFGGSAQVGASVAWNQFNNTTEAYIGDPGNAQTQGTGYVRALNLNLNATANEALWAISLAADKASGEGESNESGTGPDDTTEGSEGTPVTGTDASGNTEEGKYGFGASGNVIINDMNDTTETFINSSALTYAQGAVNLNATDNSWDLAGGLAASLITGGTDNALAGAYSRNDLTKTTEATIANANVSGATVSLDATSTGDVLTIAGGGSIAGSGNSLAGSVANNPITNTTEAGLGAGVSVDAGGDINIDATTDDNVISVAGAISGSGKNALGLALDWSQYGNTTLAFIADGDSVTTFGNLNLQATTDDTLLPIAASLAIGGSNSLSGSATQDGVNDTTKSTIGAATVLATGNLLVAGTDDTALQQIVGSAAGSGGNAVGLSGAISTSNAPLLQRETDATIAANANVTAWGNDGDPIVFDGQNVIGTALDAANTGNVDSFVAGGSLAADVSVAAELILNYISENANAVIGNGAQINVNDSNDAAGDQSVAVNASDNTGFLGLTGALSVGGTGAVGAAADTETLTRNVYAVIGAGANVNAAGNVLANAALSGGLTSYAVAGGFSSSLAADGAASILGIYDTTKAEIDGNATAGGSVDVNAGRNTSVSANEGGLSLALDGSLAVALAKVTTNENVIAGIGTGADVTALGNSPVPSYFASSSGGPVADQMTGVSVTAVANGTLTDYSVGGAIGGVVGATGSGVLNNLTDTTTASIGDNAAITGPAVNVLASDTTNLTDAAGAAAAGAIGIGAAGDGLPSDPNTLDKTTIAELNGAVVNTPGALGVQALSNEHVVSYAGAAAAGIGGLAGSLANYQISPTTEALISACSSCSGTQLDAGSLILAATDTVGGKLLAGGFAIGAVGFGGALIQATMDSTTTATLGGGVSVSTPGAVAINSTLTDTIPATAYAAAGGVIGVSGAESDLDDNSETSATIGSDASIQGASSVAMNVTSRRELEPTSLGAAIGAVAGGLSEDIANLGGGTAATIGAGAQIGAASAPVGSFALDLFDYSYSDPTATALAGGVVSGTGAQAESDGFSRSESNVGNDAAIFTTGNLDLEAQDTSTLYPTVNTEQIGALNGGSAIAEANNSTSAELTIGAANLISGGQLTVSLGGLSEADVNSTSAASSSIASGAYTDAEAEVFPFDELSIGQGAALTAAGAVTIEGSGNNGANATANGQAGTFNVAFQGATYADATTESTTEMLVNGAVTSTGGNVSIEAFGGGQADSRATGGSGGGIYSGANTSSTSEDNNTTLAQLNSAADINAANGTINFTAGGSESADTDAYLSGDSSIIPTSLVDLLEGDATTNATNEVHANVLGATLSAKTVNLDAQSEQFYIFANSEVFTGGDGNARALALINAVLRAEVTVSNANITGTQAVNLLASSAEVQGGPAALTEADSLASNAACDFCVGELHSDSYDNFNDSSIINGGAGPSSSDIIPYALMSGLPGVSSFGHITTPNLNVQALLPLSYTNGETVWGNENTDANGNCSCETDSDGSGPNGDDGGSTYDWALRWISLQGTVQGAPAAPISLLVATNGTYTGNLPVIASDPNDLVLGNVTGGSGSLPSINLTEGAGPNGGADFLSSNDYGGWINSTNTSGVQTAQGSGATVTITNNSPLNVIVGAIAAQDVNIADNGSGDVVLNGALNESLGAINITDQGGSILSTGAGSVLANQIVLDAAQGDIGTGSAFACSACGGSLTLKPVNATFFAAIGAGAPTAAFTAGGSLDVTGATLEDAASQPPATASVSVNITNLSAGGNLYLGLGEGLEDFSGSEYEATSIYNFLNGATAGGAMTLTSTGLFGGGTHFNIDGTAQSGGDMYLFATGFNQPANLTVTGATSTISAYAFVNDLDLTVQTAGGAVNAGTDEGNVNISQPSGDLNVGQITAVACIFGCGYGNVNLTANNGSIDDGENGTVTNVTANNLTLNAPNGAVGGGFFTDANASPLLVQLTGSVTANTLFDVNLTQVSGNLNINFIQNQTFGTTVDLTALNGSITGGTIVDLGDLELAAPQGSISIPQIYSYITQLSASAEGDITLGAGNSIALGNITSTSGNVSVSSGGQLAGGGTVSGVNVTLDGTSIGGAQYITTNGPAYTAALSTPLSINASGTVMANAATDINLLQTAGNLPVAGVVAGGTARLTAPGAILNTAAPGATAVAADQIELYATSVGVPGNPLPVSAANAFNAQTSSDINALSTGTMLIGDITSSGGSVNLTSTGGSLNSLNGGIGVIAAGQNVDLSAPAGSIGATSMLQVQTGSSGMLNANASGGISLTAPSGNLPLGNLIAGGEINLYAEEGSILAGIPGSNLNAGIVDLLATQSIGSATAKVNGTAGTWRLEAGTNIFLANTGNFNADWLIAPNVQLTVNGGSATVGILNAAFANLALTQPGTTLTVNQAYISDLLHASADDIQLNNFTTLNTTAPIYLSLVGANNGMAKDINATVASAVPVIVETYSAEQGSITDQGDWLMVEHAGIGQSATFANNWLSVALANSGTTTQYFTGDFVGNALGDVAGTMHATVTNLQPSATFTLPTTLTSYESWMITELSRLP